jgi:hypothetical protein
LKYFWANENKNSLIAVDGLNPPRFLDGGEEFEAAVKAGPDAPRDLSEFSAKDAPFDLEAWRAGLEVSRFQAIAALHAAGVLEMAEQLMAKADFITALGWKEAGSFRRNSPTIEAMGAALGMDETDLDNLFRAAALIEI